MEANPLAGTWRLVSCEIRASDGTIAYPMGREVRGLVVFSPAGYFSAVITGGDRSPFHTPDTSKVTAEEWAVAASSCVAYCGQYEVQSERLLLHAEASLLPNWVGTTQERLMTLDGGTLTLSTTPMLFGGQERAFHLIWKQVEAA